MSIGIPYIGLLWLVLAAGLTTSFAPSTRATSQSSINIPVTLNISILNGDVNQDEIVDVLDLVRIVAIILGNYSPTEIEYLLSDLNDDGIVDVLDVVTIVNMILNLP